MNTGGSRKQLGIPKAHADDPHYVYVAWAHGQPLYVGCSYNPAQRIYGHRKAEWVGIMDTLDIYGPWDKESALFYERETVATLRPKYNKRGKHVTANERWSNALVELMGFDEPRAISSLNEVA